MPLTSAGWVADSAAVWTQTVRDQLDTLLGRSLDYDNTLDGDWTAMVGQVAGTADQGYQIAVDALNPRTATGSALDRVVSPVVTRRPATKSRYTVDADQAGTIPAGAVFQEADGTQWEVVDTVVALVGSDVILDAVVAGPTALDPATPTVLQAVTAIPGITSVTYTPAGGNAFLVGVAIETDAALLARWSNSQGSPNAPTGPGIRRSILALSWVTAVSLSQPNPGELTVTVVPAPVGADQIDALANAIYEAAGAGILTVGTVTTTIDGADGFKVAVYWAVGATETVAVGIILTVDPTTTLAAVSGAVQATVEGTFAALSVGDTLRILSVMGAIDTVDGVNGATVLLDGVALDKVPAASTNLLVSGTYTIT
jgi:hypothetical protein